LPPLHSPGFSPAASRGFAPAPHQRRRCLLWTPLPGALPLDPAKGVFDPSGLPFLGACLVGAARDGRAAWNAWFVPYGRDRTWSRFFLVTNCEGARLWACAGGKSPPVLHRIVFGPTCPGKRVGPHPVYLTCSEGFQRATAKPFGRLRRGETPATKPTSLFRRKPRRSAEGDRKALCSPPQRRNPCNKTNKSIPKETAKECRGRPQSPLLASAEAKPLQQNQQAYSEGNREGVQRATAKPSACLRRGETSATKPTSLFRRKPRRSAEGDRKALCSPPQRRNLLWENTPKKLKTQSIPPLL